MRKMLNYNKDDIIRSFRWLGHGEHGFTELAAFHPRYKPGRDNFDYNKKHGYLPKTWYVTNEKQLLGFLNRFHGTHTCCYGINPRPEILRRYGRFVRTAKDTDIKTVLNFYFDFDLEDSAKPDKAIPALEELLTDIQFYFEKDGIVKPFRAFTGNGYHLLFALPPTSVEKYPDVRERLKRLRDTVAFEFGDSMASEGIKLDSTMDLRRVAKIYGTRKPGRRKLSRFYGNERIEDYVLKEYLLSLDLSEPISSISLQIPDTLPEKFEALLTADPHIQKLWNNEGKGGSSDLSRSGYDFSLAKECIRNGITDINDLTAILMIRPEGAVRKSGKNELYVRRTIGNALYK